MRIWDLATGKCRLEMEGLRSSILLRDGAVLSLDQAGIFWIWDPATGTRRTSVESGPVPPSPNWPPGALSLPNGNVFTWSIDISRFDMRLWSGGGTLIADLKDIRIESMAPWFCPTETCSVGRRTTR